MRPNLFVLFFLSHGGQVKIYEICSASNISLKELLIKPLHVLFPLLNFLNFISLKIEGFKLGQIFVVTLLHNLVFDFFILID